MDLRDVAAGTAEALRPDLADGGVAVAVDLPAEPVTVDGDPDRLAQIAANLVENAGRHAGALVRVAVAAEEGTVLTVTDDGPGIPADEAALGLERLHTSARPGGPARSRNGLGLALVRELARAMGGDAAVAALDGGGARLEVRLPLIPPSSGPHTGAVPSGA